MTNHVMSAMRKARGAPLPLEKAALCVTLDVIGRVGFQKDFGATASFEAVIEGKAPPPSGKCPFRHNLPTSLPCAFIVTFPCHVHSPAPSHNMWPCASVY